MIGYPSYLISGRIYEIVPKILRSHERWVTRTETVRGFTLLFFSILIKEHGTYKRLVGPRIDFVKVIEINSVIRRILFRMEGY